MIEYNTLLGKILEAGEKLLSQAGTVLRFHLQHLSFQLVDAHPPIVTPSATIAERRRRDFQLRTLPRQPLRHMTARGTPLRSGQLALLSCTVVCVGREEQDERWIAEALELPGVMTKGSSPADAKAHVQVLAFRVVADQLRAIPERRQAEIDAETC